MMLQLINYTEHQHVGSLAAVIVHGIAAFALSLTGNNGSSRAWEVPAASFQTALLQLTKCTREINIY